MHSAHDGIFLVDDPWVDPDEGESWLDGHDVPIAAKALGAMTWWGEPADGSYRPRPSPIDGQAVSATDDPTGPGHLSVRHSSIVGGGHQREKFCALCNGLVRV
ncbi:peptidase C39 family protein [Rhodococcus qingshengii]|uniref:peptidase C39 family protein n=1 Tax=Rhodococcus qingshengii TaxID=334542 RepID=UPI00355901AC